MSLNWTALAMSLPSCEYFTILCLSTREEEDEEEDVRAVNLNGSEKSMALTRREELGFGCCADQRSNVIFEFAVLPRKVVMQIGEMNFGEMNFGEMEDHFAQLLDLRLLLMVFLLMLLLFLQASDSLKPSFFSMV